MQWDESHGVKVGQNKTLPQRQLVTAVSCKEKQTPGSGGYSQGALQPGFHSLRLKEADNRLHDRLHWGLGSCQLESATSLLNDLGIILGCFL